MASLVLNGKTEVQVVSLVTLEPESTMYFVNSAWQAIFDSSALNKKPNFVLDPAKHFAILTSQGTTSHWNVLPLGQANVQPNLPQTDVNGPWDAAVYEVP